MTPQFQFEVSDNPSISLFSKFYDDLTQIVRKNLPAETQAAISQSFTPPNQTTIPSNPQYSSSSTGSGSSRESKPEHHTQTAANAFLYANLKSIETQLKRFAWYQDHNGNYRLQTTCLVSMM
jgi:hypothetical protein